MATWAKERRWATPKQYLSPGPEDVAVLEADGDWTIARISADVQGADIEGIVWLLVSDDSGGVFSASFTVSGGAGSIAVDFGVVPGLNVAGGFSVGVFDLSIGVPVAIGNHCSYTASYVVD